MERKDEIRKLIEAEIEMTDGILRLEPAWVARDFLPPGRRLGLPNEMYELGERGGICERWIGSTTKADNKISVPDEGLSFIKFSSGNIITLKEAVEIAPESIVGEEYSSKHSGLGRLPKIFDYEYRLPYHIHQMQEHAKLVGCNSKEEAYYFPEDVEMGKHPETFFGVHPYITQQKKYDVLLPHLIEWKDDAILQHSRAYKQLPGDGFHVPSGTLHAPGTALTIELQEDSDVFSMLQANTGGKIISKELLFKDVRKGDREKFGEKIILDMINWQVSGDPYFYENRHTPPVLIEETKNLGGEESWIFYNTQKFSGKRLVVCPNGKFICKDNGAYNILVWRGKGIYGGVEIEGENFDNDELLVCHNRAIQQLEVFNTGDKNLIIYKFFGPDVNPDVPMLPNYK
ncbi:MAG: hypothetical protein NTX22_08825 [Ignavibacteriales bacterium]|nr:hypothetical protein [Ignavibacteriales bacterium]